MFTVVKVRDGLAANDYADPGHYKHPPGTVAYEWTGPAAAAPRAPAPTPATPTPLRAVKPQGHKH
jgi:manganese oxidase